MKTIEYAFLLFLLWFPRIAAILFTVLISLFAFDVFGTGAGFFKTLLALIMHLIPSFLLITAIVFSWKRPWIGGIFMIVLGIVYFIWAQYNARAASFIYIVLFIIGVLFLASWFLRKQIKEALDVYNE
jgi:hypothetical protein